MADLAAVPTGAGVVVCGLLGLVVGSFLNVVIHRVPRGESLFRPRSRCPDCGHAVRPWHNVPVLGWILLAGRCADCRAPISPRYPLVELATGVAFALIAASTERPWVLAVLLYLAAVGIALSMIDLATRRLPDVVVLPSYAVVLSIVVAAAVVGGTWDAVWRAVLGGLVGYGIFRLIRLGWPAGMGGGDVKLAGLLGICTAWLGWPALVVGLFAACVAGALVGMTLIATGRAGWRSGLPFGPFLVLGAFVGIYAGPSITDAYLGLLTGISA